MKLKTRWLSVMTVFGMMWTTTANAKCVLGPDAQPMRVQSMDFQLHDSVPVRLVNAVLESVRLANQDAGREAFRIKSVGHFQPRLRDGVSTIYFSTHETLVDSKSPSKVSAYFIGNTFFEADIVVNARDYLFDEDMLRQVLRKQLSQLDCRADAKKFSAI